MSMGRSSVRSLRSVRAQHGKALRQQVSRSAQGNWRVQTKERDPIAILRESDRGRIPALVPIRYERMLQSPFAFLRGSASVMAFDLAHAPTTGIRVQACGDCHPAELWRLRHARAARHFRHQ